MLELVATQPPLVERFEQYLHETNQGHVPPPEAGEHMQQRFDPVVVAIGRLEGCELAHSYFRSSDDEVENEQSVCRAEHSADDHLCCQGAPHIRLESVTDGHHTCLRRGRLRVHGLLLGTATRRTTYSRRKEQRSA